MAKMTVSVPEELKKKMDHFSSVSWSEVAGEAFEEALKRREMRRAAESMNRLRKSTKLLAWSGAREIRKWRTRTGNRSRPWVALKWFRIDSLSIHLVC